jgi:hypothetical protein
MDGSGYSLVVGSCEHENGLPGFVKYGEFLEYVSDY